MAMDSDDGATTEQELIDETTERPMRFFGSVFEPVFAESSCIFDKFAVLVVNKVDALKHRRDLVGCCQELCSTRTRRSSSSIRYQQLQHAEDKADRSTSELTVKAKEYTQYHHTKHTELAGL
ncbi:hypothetical protein EWM64_g6907 [Hericium alpestre]|uniref:Uncharacterized protein n=1 Tax=Hericium alpestre TaxID=135208 RepID=A0A4Y9ZST9_9AGAM|nr:hypothetical protein EWM64_g6907 [Hericium alpestre]